MATSFNSYAQPSNDECVNAIDISSLFAGACGTYNLDGPYDNTGATLGADDPVDPACWGYPAGSFETDQSIWFSFSVPDLYGNGSPVTYSFNTSIGIVGGDCGITSPLTGDGDTEIAFYDGAAGCPTATSTEIYCSEDLFGSAPWISGGDYSFTPNVTYYLMVDAWNQEEGEFCMETTVCGNQCGDGTCGLTENYCACSADCACDLYSPQFISYDEVQDGFFFSADNPIWCDAWVSATFGVGTTGNVYIGFGGLGGDDCAGNAIPEVTITYDNGSLLNTAGSVVNSGDLMPLGFIHMFELTPAQVAMGSINITTTVDDGNGVACDQTVTVDFSTLDLANPYCNITCAAGNLAGYATQTVCPGGTVDLSTDGTEDLTLPCASDDGDPYEWGVAIFGDLYGTGAYTDQLSPIITIPGGPSATTNVDDILLDGFGYVTGVVDDPLPAGNYEILVGAFCLNSDGSFVEFCLTPSTIVVTLLDAADPACNVTIIDGCTDPTACNYDVTATNDDGSCEYVTCADCEGVPNGPAVAGTACDDNDAYTINDMYDANCDCVGTFNCTASGAVIALPNGSDMMTVCALDGMPDLVDASVSMAGTGVNSQWVITDAATSEILGLPAGSPPFDLEGSPVGVCQVWLVHFDGALTPAPAVGVLALDIVTNPANCIALSNPITVDRIDCGVDGCTDATACNYNPAATNDDGSCEYVTCADCEGVPNGSATPGTACDDNNANTFGDTYDANCVCAGTAVVNGCTDVMAVNYNPAATNDDGSCLYVGDPCDDGNASTINDQIQADGSCLGTVPQVDGCTDATACNYNPAANNDDGTCEYTSCADCNGVPNGPAVAGSACDDGDASTTNDVLQSDCSCAGTPIGPCLSEEGTIMFTFGGVFGNQSYICYGDNVVVDADDFILLPGQSVYYVFHTVDNDVTSGDLPIGASDVVTLGSFLTNNAGKSTVYVTAFGATNDGAGGPDYSDPCLTISNTLTIQLLDPITITTDVDCDTNTGEFSYEFTIDGGLPECLPGATYNVTGTYFNGPVTHGQTVMVGPITDGENYDISASDANSCSGDFVAAIQCEKLPIALLGDIKGEAIETGNLVSWVTATEIDNDFFTLEVSATGSEWNLVETLSGAGNSTSAIDYKVLDTKATAGTSYYRLSQTDFDGTTELVGVVEITREGVSFNVNELYPVPAYDFVNVEYEIATSSDITIEVLDMLGRVKFANNIVAVQGANNLTIDVNDYPQGVYFLTIKVGDSVTTKKFVVE